MEITHSGFGGSARPDKIMKVAQYNNHELTEEVNVSELARNMLGAGNDVVEQYVRGKDLPHFQCSVGIPDFITLEQNIADYFSKYNADCVERFAKEATKETAERVKNLAKELGVEPEKFDWHENNKFALEISRKEQESRGGGPIEVDPRRRGGVTMSE
ncbi:hypothetical protein A2662_04460 [Candidatus Giovannonibacteria bacterium RIFCSPHIGHO2_01_FULL_45_33]|uniref:Uncharacterized protein n=1 Tax=Candidatus Giovannonibacteria bacterium RIFCSPLOWO2_01_FULL_45_34 TaxID=1798351 RepID=A0A1F5WYC7_9BACT|nr:MAG: hypothetical protein A2662_04460 [Candidatus Giovannonibacteria bacterium RIFCSPHIGHO2_01_FULL_45_33]OGF69163.1 MAG: hypothetical protein A3C73_03675 [Candidatus Giovannonibacteria bacterium RIFCSPHIGHO2_02_FULL_44_11]OGF80630.1 MAG: hypothetical protein A2930_03035 [Candidatus Giovannonibacteria bacterium RIFCSPLOWO2_01_FULL_45_34]